MNWFETPQRWCLLITNISHQVALPTLYPGTLVSEMEETVSWQFREGLLCFLFLRQIVVFLVFPGKGFALSHVLTQPQRPGPQVLANWFHVSDGTFPLRTTAHSVTSILKEKAGNIHTLTQEVHMQQGLTSSQLVIQPTPRRPWSKARVDEPFFRAQEG